MTVQKTPRHRVAFRIGLDEWEALQYMAREEGDSINRILLNSLHMSPNFYKYKVEWELKKEKEERKFKKTSVMHRDIGKHKHEMVIYESYENYAVCGKCGMHDWSGREKDFSIKAYVKKYPKAKVISLLE